MSFQERRAKFAALLESLYLCLFALILAFSFKNYFFLYSMADGDKNRGGKDQSFLKDFSGTAVLCHAGSDCFTLVDTGDI